MKVFSGTEEPEREWQFVIAPYDGTTGTIEIAINGILQRFATVWDTTMDEDGKISIVGEVRTENYSMKGMNMSW